MAGPFALVGAISMPQTDPVTRPADHLDRVATTVAAHLYPRDTRRATVATSHVRYRLHSHPLPPEPLPGPVARRLPTPSPKTSAPLRLYPWVTPDPKAAG